MNVLERKQKKQLKEQNIMPTKTKKQQYDLTAVNEARAMGSIEYAQGGKGIPALSAYMDELIHTRFSSKSDFDHNTRINAMKSFVQGFTQAKLADRSWVQN